MSRKKLRFSLHLKLIVSYIAVTTIIAVISVGFVYLFASSYILTQTRQRLAENSEAFAKDAAQLNWSYDTQITDLQIVFRRNIDDSVSLILTDPEFHSVEDGGMNVDHLGPSVDDFVRQIASLPSPLGAHTVRYGDTVFSVYVQQVYNASTGRVLGYVILFTVPLPYRLQSWVLSLYLLSLGIASVLAVGVSLLFSTGLTRNLRKLKTKADLVANRQFDVPVSIHSHDEVEDLSLSIDRMARSLSEYDAGQKKFLQNASHELRTPLMSIRGYVEGLKDGVFDDPDQVADQVLEQVDRLEKLTGELIYLSKIENTNEVIDRVPVRISDLFEEAVSRVNGIAEPAGIRIVQKGGADLTVDADPEKLVTALTNLLSNGLRFAREEIEISWRTQEPMAVISVADDGPGVAPEDLEHLFDRFYKGKQGKYGLGLSIVNAIVVAHDGIASVRNKSEADGTGAVFEIRIPLTKRKKSE